jgi:type IV secretory pathway TraG/TraD family ATPase VirD4
MRLLDERAEDEEGKLPPVWFLLDEVALLQKLPKLARTFSFPSV